MKARSASDSTNHTSSFHASNRKFQVILYAAIVFFYWMSQYLYIPTLPVYIRSKTDDLALVGVVLSMYGLWQAIIRLPLGIAADWVGWRKPFTIACFILSGVGALIMGTTDSITWMLIGRALTGLAAGSWVLLIVTFNRLFPPEQTVRMTAMITMISSVSRMSSTGVTGFLNKVGSYSLAFYLAAGIALLSILMIIPAQEDRQPPKRPTFQKLVTLVTRRDVLLPSILSAIVQYAIWTTTFGFFPILIRQLGASEVTQSLFVTMNIALMMFGNLIVTTLVQRFGVRRMIYIAFVVHALGIGLAALAPSLAVMFIAQFTVGFSSGMNYPLLMGLSIQHVDDGERATAMGLHQAVYSFGMFGGPWLSGVLANVLGLRPMFGVTAVVCVVLGVLGTRLLADS